MKQLLIVCPNCNFETIELRTVEKQIRGGHDTVLLKVEAEVCSHCGERYYSPETMELFDSIREKLSRGEHSGMRPVGQVFQLT